MKTITCSHAQDAILQGDPTALSEDVQTHTDNCRECAALRNAMNTLKEAGKAAEPAAPSPALDAAILRAAARACPKRARPLGFFGLHVSRPALSFAAAATLLAALFVARLITHPASQNDPSVVIKPWEDEEFQEQMADMQIMIEGLACTVEDSSSTAAADSTLKTQWEDTPIEEGLIELQAEIFLQET